MAKNQLLVIVAVCSLFLLVALGGFVLGRSTPAVVTQEVTRIVVATPTPTPSPVIAERVITVTVVVAATPVGSLGETPPMAATPAATEQMPNGEATTPNPSLSTIAPTIESQPLIVVDGLDDPALGLAMLSEVAQVIQSRGIHTLRLKMDLSILIEVTVMNQQQVDENLTQLVRNELSKFDVQGNYIIDISIDDLAQQKWVIEALGGVVGFGNSEEVAELRQNGSQVWEKPLDGEWSLRNLTEDEALFPLGGSLIIIDDYTHALNLSDLVIDALRPLLLAENREQPGLDQAYGWTGIDDASSTSASFLEVQRERVIPSSNNLKAIAAALANSGLSAFVDPAAVTNGIQQTTSFEKAWLVPETWLVDHGQIDVQGEGVVEATHLMQQKLVDTTVILRANNSFEYLLFTTNVTAPEE